MKFFEHAESVWGNGPTGEMNSAIGIFWDVPASSGRLRITSAGRFRVFVNGIFFAHGPERAAHGYARVEEWDLESGLVRPLNRVAVEVLSPGIASYYTIKEPAFVQAEIISGDAIVAFTAPGACQATALPHHIRKVHRYSFQRTFSEVYREHSGSSAWRVGGPARSPLTVRTVPAPALLPRRAPLPEFPLYEASPVDCFPLCGENGGGSWG
jgi:alpha-L-rhamnosidase